MKKFKMWCQILKIVTRNEIVSNYHNILTKHWYLFSRILFSLTSKRKIMEFNKEKKFFFVQYRPRECTYWLCWLFCFINVVCCVWCWWFLLFVGYSRAARNCPLLSTLVELNCMHSPHDATRCPFTAFVSTALSRKQDLLFQLNLRKHSFSFSSRLYFFFR